MSRQNYNRHPYMRDDLYWELFGHLVTVYSSEAFRKRVQEQLKICEKKKRTEYHYPKNHE